MNLFIDFDGVILDTIPVLYNLLKENNIDKKDEIKVTEFISKTNWKEIIKTTPQINDSIKKINKMMKESFFNVSILTHVNSLEEAIEKINYIEELIPDATIIPVPKSISKTKMVHTKGSILVDDYKSNLEEWEKEGGISILFSKELEESKYITINDLDMLLKLFQEKGGKPVDYNLKRGGGNYRKCPDCLQIIYSADKSEKDWICIKCGNIITKDNIIQEDVKQQQNKVR